MIENPVTCSPALPLLKCIEKMRSNKVDSLMVVDREAKLLGILKASQVRARHDQSLPVSQYMDTEFLKAHPEDTIVDVLGIVEENKASNIPIVDGNGTLCGLITKSSLVTTLSQQFLDNEEGGHTDGVH